VVVNNQFIHSSPINPRWKNIITYDSSDSIEKKYNVLKNGLRAWSEKTYHQRAKSLLDLSEILIENKQELIDLVCLETGKLKNLSEAEFESAIRTLRLLTAYEFLPSGRILPSVNPRRLVFEERSPLGIALLIFPSNAPLPNFLGKIAPALMAGNVVLAKPSPYTAVIFSRLLEFMRKAGFEEDVIQRIDGEAVVVTKILELGVDLISFTGSTIVGKEILKMSSFSMPKVILECGGVNSFIVLPDANFDECIKAFCDSAFSNTGQRCVAAKRVLVHQEIADDFQAAVINHMSSTKFGADVDAQIGPMCSPQYVERLSKFVGECNDAFEQINLGYPGVENEFTYQPKLLIEKLNGKRAPIEEMYGPVAVLSTFKSSNEALEIANSSDFRLTTAVWTQNIREMSYFKRELWYGVINFNGPTHGSELNFPFGGYGMSGNGVKDSGYESIREYSTTKVVSMFESRDFHG
jgi:acyl-CoA reductase-like NAD-dependent aldehyde dehydrogenase